MDARGRPPRFEQLLATSPLWRRRLLLAGLLSDALLEVGGEVIVVGGTALELHTLGGYSTQDLDLVCNAREDLVRLLDAWGFVRSGRHYHDERLDIAVEIPDSVLNGALARTVEASMDGPVARVIGIEDLLLDRLRAAVHWASPSDRFWARVLLETRGNEIDMEYTQTRAQADGTTELLVELLDTSKAGE